jgi:hypothetical protein
MFLFFFYLITSPLMIHKNGTFNAFLKYSFNIKWIIVIEPVINNLSYKEMITRAAVIPVFNIV